MTRMWGIDPALLCDRHLLGEHAELHQLVGTIERHPHGEAIARGHAEKGNIDTSLIETRHEVLAAELTRRGFAHDSPIVIEDRPAIGSIDIEANRQELASRCEACRARIEADTD